MRFLKLYCSRMGAGCGNPSVRRYEGLSRGIVSHDGGSIQPLSNRLTISVMSGQYACMDVHVVHAVIG